jgi:predicted O-methyltransferase YrrM
MKKWQDIEGFFSHNDSCVIQTVSKDKIVLEIGSWKGRSTVCIAEIAEQVFACDPHTAFNTQLLGEEFISLEEWKENTKGYENIILLLGKSIDEVPKLRDDFFDVVFIDGCHFYASVKEDIELSIPKLKNEGIFVFHDWGWDGNNDGGVCRAVHEKFKSVEVLGGIMACSKKMDLK